MSGAGAAPCASASTRSACCVTARINLEGRSNRTITLPGGGGMGADRIFPKAFIQEEETGRPAADRLPPRPVARLETATSGPLIGAKQPEIRFLHENSKSVPAGSNPSKRHRADRGMIALSDQEPSKGRSTPGFARSRRSQAASLAAEGKSMVSNGTRNNIGAALARSSQDPVIFIVDDDVALRESLRGLFRDVHLQAEVFGSPTELLASRQPDAASCLVLDIRLPDMSGLDFQAQLARANIDIPVIFITGYADIPMAVRAIRRVRSIS